MTEQEALKLALEALKTLMIERGSIYDKAITAIEEALAQPEQHQDWCASLTQMLMSMPPKPAPCNCKPKRECGRGYEEYQKGWNAVVEPRNCNPKPKQEPVAVWELFEDGWDSIADPEWMETLSVGTKLYTTPPQRTWVGLTLEEILETYRGPDGSDYVDYARGIEAKLKEKNT